MTHYNRMSSFGLMSPNQTKNDSMDSQLGHNQLSDKQFSKYYENSSAKRNKKSRNSQKRLKEPLSYIANGYKLDKALSYSSITRQDNRDNSQG